jgi:hypothetical protein
MLTAFNWTDSSRTHRLSLADLGLSLTGNYRVHDILTGKEVSLADGAAREEEAALA